MLENDEFDEQKIQSPLQYIWSIFKGKSSAVMALWGIVILLLVTLLAGNIAPHIPSTLNSEYLLLPPYWFEGGSTAHILGTDDLGRDTLARLLQGTQLTLGGALLISACIFMLGTLIGASAALSKGLKSSVLLHLLDALLTLPTLLMALILIVLFGASYSNCLLAVLLSLLPQFIRGIYLCIEIELNKQYIIALRMDGATNFRLLRYGIFPNILEPLTTISIRIFTMAVLEISTLGFLGFGTQLPNVELGSLIAGSLDLIYLAPALVLFPGITIFIIILVFNVFAEGVRHSILEGEE
ncbi:peptide ABC transporter protein inner membrane binding component SapC [Psychromonas sp. CNPT3]|uniref:ABC transporter permease subunit n=1 Tax=Psychromonas sp. CNPT3 TaxID=314282 RepID=UPI00006E4808|nr:ABC transporter permease subunit [Psychromonas sp. CNPT3]AGH81263.1 peptide ABC transporter protein inner membrane binding component SapC [Psychromonas sp. CNPT3]